MDTWPRIPNQPASGAPSRGGSALPPPGTVVMASVEEDLGDGMYALRWNGNRISVTSQAILRPGQSLILKSEMSPEGKPTLVVQGPALPDPGEMVGRVIYGPGNRARPTREDGTAETGERQAASQPREGDQTAGTPGAAVAAGVTKATAAQPEQRMESLLGLVMEPLEDFDAEAEALIREANEEKAALAPGEKAPTPEKPADQPTMPQASPQQPAPAPAPATPQTKPADPSAPTPPPPETLPPEGAETAEMPPAAKPPQTSPPPPAEPTMRPEVFLKEALTQILKAAELPLAGADSQSLGVGGAMPEAVIDKAAAILVRAAGLSPEPAVMEAARSLVEHNVQVDRETIQALLALTAGTAETEREGLLKAAARLTAKDIPLAAPLASGLAEVLERRTGATELMGQARQALTLENEGSRAKPLMDAAAELLDLLHVDLDGNEAGLALERYVSNFGREALGKALALVEKAAQAVLEDHPLLRRLDTSLTAILSQLEQTLEEAPPQPMQSQTESGKPSPPPASTTPAQPVQPQSPAPAAPQPETPQPQAVAPPPTPTSTESAQAVQPLPAPQPEAPQPQPTPTPTVPEPAQTAQPLPASQPQPAPAPLSPPPGVVLAPSTAGPELPPATMPSTTAQPPTPPAPEAADRPDQPQPANPEERPVRPPTGVIAAINAYRNAPRAFPGLDALSLPPMPKVAKLPPSSPQAQDPQPVPEQAAATPAPQPQPTPSRPAAPVVPAAPQPSGEVPAQPQTGLSTAAPETAVPTPAPSQPQPNPVPSAPLPPATATEQPPVQNQPQPESQPQPPAQPQHSVQQPQQPQPPPQTQQPSPRPPVPDQAMPEGDLAADKASVLDSQPQLSRDQILSRLPPLFQTPGINRPEWDILRPNGALEKFLEGGNEEKAKAEGGALARALTADDSERAERALRELPGKDPAALKNAAQRLSRMEAEVVRSEPLLTRLAEAATSLRDLGRQLLAVKAENLAGHDRDPGVMLAEIPFKLNDDSGDGRMQMFYRRTRAKGGGWTSRVILDLNTTSMGPVLGDMRFFGQDMVVNMFVDRRETAAFLEDSADALVEDLLGKGFRAKVRCMVLPPPVTPELRADRPAITGEKPASAPGTLRDSQGRLDIKG